jgi:hypothetical protein
MPRVNDRRVAHKSTGGIPPKIPTPVGPVGNAPSHLTPNTVALSANQSVRFTYILEKGRNSARNVAFFLPAAHRRELAHAGFARFGAHYLRAK